MSFKPQQPPQHLSDEEDDLRIMFSDPESEFGEEGQDYEDFREETAAVGKDKVRPEKVPPDIQILISQAQTEFVRGHYDDALKLCEEAVKINGNIRATYNLIVAIYDDQGDKEKALFAKFHAATLNKGSQEDWQDLVMRSLELDKKEDAAMALQHLSSIDKDNWTWRWDRAKLYLDLKKFGKALNVLNRLRSRYFHKVGDSASRVLIIKDISTALQALGRYQDAIDMYKKIYDDNIEYALTHDDDDDKWGLQQEDQPQKQPQEDSMDEEDDEADYDDRLRTGGGADMPPQNSVEVIFDTICIEEYAALLQRTKQWRQAITVVKTGLRRLHYRIREKYWDDMDNDIEYDDTRRASEIDAEAAGISTDPQAYEIPIDHRVILLSCRLKLYSETGNTSYLDDALSQIPYLEKEVEVNSGLYHIRRNFWKAANAFFSAKEYGHARKLYDDLGAENMGPTDEEYTSSIIQVAKCFNLLKSPHNAIVLYKTALESDPDNIHALIGLAESYHEVGQKELSKSLVARAVNFRARQLDIGDGHIIAPREIPEFDDFTDPALFAADKQVSVKKQAGAAAKAQFEQNQSELADSSFVELERFREGLEKGNEVAAGEWIRHATILIQIFRSNKKFFPSDRNKQFIANTSSAVTPNLSLDERLDRIRAVTASNDDDSEEMESISFKFKEKTFEKWFELFMQTALARARYDNIDTAYMIIRTGKMSNVFHNDPRRELTMDLVQLSCAFDVKDFPTVSEILRHLYSKDQFNDEILLMYNALLPGGQAAMDVFGSANNQKFILRNIKALDSAVNKREIKGAAKLTTDDSNVKESPILRLLYAQIMLMGPSYTPALTYLLAALHSLPEDPIVLLTLAVVCMQRALQRVTPNRHLQILQGLSFMQDYVAVRSKTDGQRQEANYNMGRFFHGLGLFSLAVPFYDKVFEYKVDCDYNLNREAAYNLHLIYAISGNMRLARKVIDEHLEI